MIAVRAIIEGRVQGVGFRAWTAREAERRGLAGYVRNLPDGRVEAVFCGATEVVDDMLDACRRGPRMAAVSKVATVPETPRGWPRFDILPGS